MVKTIASVATGLPHKCYSNDEIANKFNLDTSDQWISERTGIKSRYLLDPEETLLSLVIQASKKAIDQVPEADISLIIVATNTYMSLPTMAVHLHRALNLPESVTAFDINDVCNGFVQGIQVARAMIHGTGKSAMIVGADQFSRRVDWSDRSTCVLFGDGAGTIILNDQPQKLFAKTSYTISKEVDLFSMDPFLKMDGSRVFKFAVQSMTDDIKSILDQTGLDVADIKYVIPHQANARIINAVAQNLGGNVVQDIAQYGNTSAATIPIALNQVFSNLTEGDKVIFTAFGAGLRGGSVLIEM